MHVQASLISGFVGDKGKRLSHDNHSLYIQMEETSLSARRCLVCGCKSLSCVEMCYIVTREALDVKTEVGIT